MKTSNTTRKKNKLEKEAEEIWKQLALKKWGTKCLACGELGDVFHHFIPKSRSVLLRFDVENAIPICSKCHYKIHFSSKPTEIHRIVEEIRRARGKDWCDYIDVMEREPLKGTYGIHYLENLIVELKKQL